MLASGKMLGMKQTTDIQETKALIKGLPTWHLTGVTYAAVPAIKDTGFWVHYRSFGLDGWYIAAPNAVLPHFKAALAKQGVGVEAVKKLPRKYIWLLAVPLHLYVMFGWILAAAPHMGKVWLAVTVGHVFCMATGFYTRRVVYAEILAPKQVSRSSSFETNKGDDTSDPAFANIPGTDAWMMYPSLRDD